MKMTRRNKAIGICLIAVLSAVSTASAAIWTGGSGTASWSDSGNWDAAAAPGKIDAVNIDDAVVNFDVGGHFERSSETMLTGDMVLTISGKRFLHGNSESCILTVSDNAQIIHNGDYFIVGQNYPGRIDQTGGSVSTTINRGFFMTDRSGAEGSSYNLLGGTLNVNYVTQADDFWNSLLGIGASGILYVNGGDAVFSADASLNNRRIYIKRDSVLQVDSGSAKFTGFKWFSVGRSDEGEARVIVNGGLLNITTRSDGALIIGGENSRGRLEVNGGILEVVSPNGMWVGDGANCQRAVVEQTAGDVIVDGGNVVLGVVSSAVNTYYRMDGGTLTAGDIVLHADADASVKFIFNAGEITVDGDRTGLVDQAWFEAAAGTTVEYDSTKNLTYISRIPYAHNPVPANGSVDLGTFSAPGQVDVELTWNTGLDVDPKNNPGLPNKLISKHILYMSTGMPTDPNLYFVAEIEAGNPVSETGSYGPLTLDMDRVYFWRVDESAGLNTHVGPTWSFATPRPLPLMSGINPTDILADAGQTVEITASYTRAGSSVTDVIWYLDGAVIDPLSDSNISINFTDIESTLTIASMSETYDGLYSCTVSNAGGNSEPSADVKVAVKKLVAWYAFEGNLEDSISDKDGTPVGEPNYIDGYIGKAVRLDGIADAVSIPLSITDSFSIELWVKTTSAGGTGGWWEGSGLVDGEMLGNVDDFGTVVRGSKFGFGVGNPEVTISSITDINDDQWHYCVATRDHFTGEIKVYVDGEMEAADTGGTGSKSAPAALRIGGIQVGGNFLSGLIDEVKLYNYPLAELTIAAKYNAVTGNSVCVYSQRPDSKFDLNGDCVVNIMDYADFATGWLECGLYPNCQ